MPHAWVICPLPVTGEERGIACACLSLRNFCWCGRLSGPIGAVARSAPIWHDAHRVRQASDDYHAACGSAVHACCATYRLALE